MNSIIKNSEKKPSINSNNLLAKWFRGPITPFILGLLSGIGFLFVVGMAKWIVGGLFLFCVFRLLTAYFKRKLDSVENIQKDPLQPLRQKLSRLKFAENVETLGEKAAAQLQEATRLSKLFTATLDDKFDRSELTYERFAGSGQATFLAICGSLNEIAEILQQVSLIPSNIDLQSDKAKIKAELATKADQLFDINEKAITQMNKANLELAAIKTRNSLDSKNLDTLLQDLAELANRAKLYSKQ